MAIKNCDYVKYFKIVSINNVSSRIAILGNIVNLNDQNENY